MTAAEVADRILAITGTKLGVTVKPPSPRYYVITFSEPQTSAQWTVFLDATQDPYALPQAVDVLAVNNLKLLK